MAEARGERPSFNSPLTTPKESALGWGKYSEKNKILLNKMLNKRKILLNKFAVLNKLSNKLLNKVFCCTNIFRIVQEIVKIILND